MNVYDLVLTDENGEETYLIKGKDLPVCKLLLKIYDLPKWCVLSIYERYVDEDDPVPIITKVAIPIGKRILIGGDNYED